MAESKSSKKTPSDTKSKVFDVSKASDVPADPTSRPIIVGHSNSYQQDPMVVTEAPTDTQPSEPDTPEITTDKSKRELKIEPGEQASKEVEEPKPVEPEKSEAEAPEPDTQIDDSAIVDELADSVSIKREQEEALEKEAKAREEVEKQIASKQYFVKIKTPPAKRNLQAFVVLVLLVLAGAGWYLLLGPGKELWAKSDIDTSASQAPTPTTQAPAATSAPVVSQSSEYKSFAQGIAFSYPKTWKAETGKETDRPGVETITLTSDEQKVKLANEGGESEVGAKLRMTVTVLNTTSLTKYPTTSVGLLLCKTEPVTINKTPYKLGLISDKSSTNPNAVILSQNDCSVAKPYRIPDQFQFGDKKNTYGLKLEYILGENYLKTTGTVDPSDVKLSQAKGIALSEANFKNSSAYKEVQKTIQSLKTVQ